MRLKMMLFFSFIIFGIFNYKIYENEKIIKYGQPLLLELTPNDPRSIIQGDYMRLRYDLENKISFSYKGPRRERGMVVVKADSNQVARFVRVYRGEPLNSGEKLIKFKKEHWKISLYPGQFFFQEGDAEIYSQARYAIFKYNDSGQYLLTALADQNKQIIKSL